MFSDNYYFSERSEIFRNIFRANFQKFKFSNVLHIFVLRCVFFRTFESVDVHELGTAGLRIQMPAKTNKSIRKAAFDQPEFDTIHSAYNKIDLIQFCSARVFHIPTWLLSFVSHLKLN